MKDSALVFNRECHVLYSKPCKKQIQEKIALHYPAGQREEYVQQHPEYTDEMGYRRNR